MLISGWRETLSNVDHFKAGSLEDVGNLTDKRNSLWSMGVWGNNKGAMLWINGMLTADDEGGRRSIGKVKAQNNGPKPEAFSHKAFRRLVDCKRKHYVFGRLLQGCFVLANDLFEEGNAGAGVEDSLFFSMADVESNCVVLG